MIKKTVIINRAVPGSGKTTITNFILKELVNKNIDSVVHSTDDFFMINNRYIFDKNKLTFYHERNFEKFQKSIKNNIDVIVCDNTNISPWETEPYTKFARKHNYQIIIITLNPREVEKHLLVQEVTKENPDAHGISKETLENMIVRYYNFDDLLNKKIVKNPVKHIQYTWDPIKKEKQNIRIADYFDSDFIIRIMPDEFKERHFTIGKEIITLLKGTKIK